MRLPKPKVPKMRVPRDRIWNEIPLPTQPQVAQADEQTLTGQVQGQPASAPEENLANALDDANYGYIFRYTIGAPKGLPGWKEVDFLVSSNGMIYCVEVDTAFTHRNKEHQDKLHDAIILQDERLKQMGQLFPEVIHGDGDTELATQKEAMTFVKTRIG